MPLRARVFISILFLSLILISGCKNRSAVEKGLTYNEYITRAEKYQGENDITKSIAYYKEALKIRPADARTHYILGELYFSEYTRSYNTAQNRLTFDLLTGHKNVPTKLKNYGFKKKYKELAMQQFREALKYDPGNFAARCEIAANYYNIGQYAEAIKEARKAIEVNPQYVNSYTLAGESYAKVGSYDLAVKYLTKATELDPTYDYAYYKLGLVYRKMNKGDKVNEILNKLKKRHSMFYDELRLDLYSGD